MAAYLIVSVDVHNPEVYARDYAPYVPAILERLGGKFIVRGGDPEPGEGTWSGNRVVVIEFPDRAAARAFLTDEEYAPIAAVRHANATSNSVIVDTFEG